MRKALLILLIAQPAFASVDLRLDGDRLWLAAERASMRDVMQAFSHAGVIVRFDPAIQAECNGLLTNAPADKALADLFDKFGYVITWDVVHGPVGDLTRLAGIDVFLPGHKESAVPITDDGRLHVTTIPGHAPFVADEILIGFKPGTTMDQVRRLLAQSGGTIVSSIPKLGVYRIRLPPSANVLSIADQLKRSDIVAEVEPNYVSKLPLEKNAALNSVAKLRTPTPAVKGAATVAVLDSGLVTGRGFDKGVVGSYDAIQPGSAITDSVGHGTQMSMLVAGSVAANGTTEVDANGVPVLAVRAFDEAGQTSNYALMRALDYAQSQGARVVNMSWGSDTSSDFMLAAIQQAQNNGMVLVAAAGNEPTGTPFYPSAYPGVVSVSALTADGTIWPSSNYGDTVTVSAPGTAEFPIGHDGPPGTYAGTSIASAYVSRAIAEYLTANPTATTTDAINALKSSVTPVGTGKDSHYGYGKLDAAAMKKLLGK